ncbi:MAG: hypothetical protein IKP28_01610 [Clostridia bacterium]|nr:hypothetical protein [Clostridia bacterium]
MRDGQLKGPLTGFTCATGSMYFHMAAMNGGNYASTQEFITNQCSAGNYNGSVVFAYNVTIKETGGRGQRRSFDDIEVGDLCIQLSSSRTNNGDHHMCLVVWRDEDHLYTFDTNATKKVGIINRNQVETEECMDFYDLPRMDTRKWVVASPEGLYRHFGK